MGRLNSEISMSWNVAENRKTPRPLLVVPLH